MTLRVSDVCFAYRADRPVLRDVGFIAETGVTVILGANGAGKSTLLRVVAGLLTPDRGGVELQGEALSGMRGAERARRIAYIAQSPSVAASLTVRQVVRLGRVVIGASEASVDRALDRVSLGERAGEPFHTLSTGQQQRVMLARAIAQLDGPAGSGRALIADEPISSLDPRHALDAASILREVARDAAVVIVVHDPTLALRIADRAVLLTGEGRVLCEGPAPEVITAERLEAIYGVGFDRAGAGEGVVLTPRMPGRV